MDIEPSVLKWLIESSGWTKDEVAKRLKTSPQTIDKFLDATKKPTFRQLEEHSKAFKKPIATNPKFLTLNSYNACFDGCI